MTARTSVTAAKPMRINAGQKGVSCSSRKRVILLMRISEPASPPGIPSEALELPLMKGYDGSRLFSERLPMKRASVTMCVTIIILAISGSTTAQSAQPTMLESELRAVLQQRWNALTRKDAKAYGALLDDDVLVPDSGSVYDKKTLIERVTTIKETSTEPRDLRVHGDNHAAVIVYRTTSHVLLAGQEITEELRVVESYAKRNERWLLTARGFAPAATSGTRSKREASAQPACTNGLKPSASRAADGRRTRSGMRTEKQTRCDAVLLGSDHMPPDPELQAVYSGP